MASKVGAGCQECRNKHVRCDRVIPVCGRCVSSGHRCTRGRAYRNHKHTYSKDQRWVNYPAIDESKFTAAKDDGVMSCDESASDDDDYNFSPSNTTITEETGNVGSPVTSTASALPRSEYSQSPLQRGSSALSTTPGTTFSTSPLGPVEPSPNFSHVVNNVFLPPAISPVRSIPRGPSIYLDEAVWPLNIDEANLFGHYTQKLAKWLDLCDPNQHFQVEVPRRAGTCPVLLNAIFALSARHLNLTGNYDEVASNHYHAKCFDVLIPLLNDPVICADETLFATMIILRVLEEIELLETGKQGLGHLSGIQSFVRTHGASVMQGGLGEAAFWVGLRQEIYVATIAERAIQINIDVCGVDRSVNPTSDFGWANRAVVHLADVLNCCFGEDGVLPARWTILKNEGERWHQSKPSSFTPYYYKKADRSKGEAFPEIRHTHPCHIIGIQHHQLAQILLLSHNPKVPRVGGSRGNAELAMKNEIMDNLRELCGIGLANRNTAPGMFTACMGIAMCGDRFDDRLDQEELLKLLIETEKVHARPTAAIQKQMKRAWGWEG